MEAQTAREREKRQRDRVCVLSCTLAHACVAIALALTECACTVNLMVTFVIHAPPAAICALSVASVHGLADLARPRHLTPYILPLVPSAVPSITPLIAPLVTPLFLAASVCHFAHDVKLSGSVLLHALCGVLYFACGPEASFAAMSMYYGLLHVPMAYSRMANASDKSALRICLCASIVLVSSALLFLIWRPSEFDSTDQLVITDAMQLLVVAHACTNDICQRK